MAKSKNLFSSQGTAEKTPPELQTLRNFCCPRCGWQPGTSEQSSQLMREIISQFNSMMGTKYSENNQQLRKLLNSLINDGYSLQDFNTVHTWAKSEWTGTRMEQYIRPITLWRRSKFAAYRETARASETVRHERAAKKEEERRQRDPYRDAEAL